MIIKGWIIKFLFSKAENKLDLKGNTLLPSEVVPSGKINNFLPSDNKLKILFFWNKLSDLTLLIKIVDANLDKNPKISQCLTSDLATNLNGTIDPKIGMSK